ncbi:MAG: DUF4249 domain-containing protein [Saprospiraceae bacterium]|nr:DUF4249 domain-containing protein [Saprospiraceae bacterium]
MLRNLLSEAFCYCILVASTCERPVELPFDIPDPRLVVVCNFTGDAFFIVQVSKSRSALDQSPEEYIANAKVDIYQGSTFIETLELVPRGGEIRTPYYITRELKPKQGIVYTIRVEAPGFETVMAQSSVPQATEILSFNLSDITVSPAAGGALQYDYTAEISFDDTPNELNYYHLNLYQQFFAYELVEGDTFLIDSTLQTIVFSNSINNNSLLAYFSGGILFEDKAFLFNRIAIPVLVQIKPESEIIGKVYAELRTVSEEYYKFHQTLNRQQNNPGGAFTEPVIVYNNIENGHGIFAGYNASTDSVFVRR